jgi:hypothetical protein
MLPTEVAKLFVDKANRLRRCSFITAQKSFSCRWSVDYPDELSVPGLDEDGLDAFILTLRFFLQDKEPISLRRFCEDTVPCLSLSTDDLAAISRVRADLNAFLDSRLILPWTFPPTSYTISTHRDLLYTYLYGQYAHATQHYFRLSTAVNSWGISRAMMTCLYLKILKIVSEVAFYIADILGKARVTPNPATQPVF